MDSAPAPHHDTLRLDLRFELTLTHEGPMPAWRADLAGPGTDARLRFESLTELIRYLARLDLHAPPPRGIR